MPSVPTQKERALTLLETGGRWSVEDLATALMVTPDRTAVLLTQMADAGLVRNPEKGQWELVPEPERAVAVELRKAARADREAGVRPPSPGRRHIQPFRGASLPKALADYLTPSIEVYGASRLFRAMALVWRALPAEEREVVLLKADTPESSTAALRDLEEDGAAWKTAATKAVRQAFVAAQKSFPTALDALTEDELRVLRQRLVEHDAPTLEAVGEEMGLTKQAIQQIGERGLWKLRKWLVHLLAGTR